MAVLESAALRPHVPLRDMISAPPQPPSALTAHTSGMASTAPRPAIESPRISANPGRVLSKGSPLLLCNTTRTIGYRFKPSAADLGNAKPSKTSQSGKIDTYLPAGPRVADVVTREFSRDLHVIDSGGLEVLARRQMDDISAPALGRRRADLVRGTYLGWC
ncbi:hypothetical protein BU25DRAFT_421317 [Macroventuria anomochaeta]|uniref:Uncharacterized protein n=1 Tax=Macroventuria anomochaeta TaxID=301207 RepID=A0ACB6S2M5_9PLEO|nr:uncharacterized protein BU25DRAFT_421317 [Macroventuria anomochaeta]KAF2627777.1 hypothetical protein BU25DRAFT_421317 [Macroventuria anomochaeta]